MFKLARLGPRARAGISLAAVFAVGMTAILVTAAPAVADPVAVQQRLDSEPTADALPTVQINGVAWTQLIVGNTVYVGGNFTSARPAGSPLGTNEVPRAYLLSYDLTTGELNPTFNPTMNQQVNALAASPDGTRLYVGGQFTAAGGVARYRIAAFDTATGALIASFQPKVDYTVSAMAATASTLYVGGAFSSAGGSPHSRLAAFTTSNGALMNWTPTADNTVQAMAIAGDGSKLIIGGIFANVNGVLNRGTAALDPVTGALLPWAANQTVTNNGTGSGILSLVVDGNSVYGGGFKFGSVTGNLEGVFKADLATGAIQWIEDCHGDTYGVYASATALYQVGHSHYCGNNMGWSQPAVWDYNRAIAFTKNPTGTLIHDPVGYTNFAGYPSPSLKSWFPNLTVGTFTGKSQAAWAVTGNGTYTVLGGEFLAVNGIAQQGLVRFAVKGTSPGTSGPLVTGALYKPTLTSTTAGTVRIAFPANWDRDSRTLTYKIYRNGLNTTPIYTTTAESAEWERPALGYTDTGLIAGSTQNYRLQVNDSDGNTILGDSVPIVVSATTVAPSSYGQTVLTQGASLYWPLNDPSGTTTARDWAGYNDAAIGAGVTTSTDGAVSGDGSMTFSGAAGGSLAGTGSIVAPNTYSVEAWFKTTTIRGGRIIGFSDLKSDSSAHRDRQVYMGNNGRLNYAVYAPTGGASFASANAYNDGQWHQVVATLGSGGMALYVDGLKVGSRTDITAGEKYIGYWRVGGDNASGFNNTPTSGYFAGNIDEVSAYPTVLNSTQINAQYTASSRTSSAPSDSYGAAVFNDEPTVYYRLGEASGTVATDSAAGLNPGTYQGTTTKGVAGALSVTTNTAVSFNGSNGFVASNNLLTNPTVYSVEAWVKTTTTTGGKIIGFGNAKVGLSTNYDRHLYMQNDGKVVFGANTVSSIITSPTALNDGQWHYLVGNQGPGGMTLYVDGLPVGTNAQITPAGYNGYWRVGGDRTWGSTSSYLNGTVDEAAAYPTVLSANQVKTHFTAGGGQFTNVAPTARFTHAESKLTTSVDASSSADSDGTIASYSWNWGDLTAAGTGVTASHLYAAAGTYPVTLTVTDNRGGTATTTSSVTVVANVAPTAVFTTSQSFLTTTVDGSTSTDTDGTIASYSWAFSDGGTATGATASHSFAAAGSYTVTLTLTDNDGGTATSTQSVTAVSAPNSAPTASFTSAVNHLALAVDGSASSDSDGTVVAYAWDFGDNVGTASTQTANYTYTGSGTYVVTLTVTDNAGLTGVMTRQVTVAPNAAPTAAIVSSSSGTTLNVNGTGSTDSDGTIAAYSWTFDDGGTATGSTASHAYPTLGTHTVSLTVTDNDGATATTTATVTLVSAYFVNDTFNRTVNSGWGTADIGGAWTVTGGSPAFSVTPGGGRIAIPAAGNQRVATLGSVSQSDVDVRVALSLDKVPVGGATQFSTSVRKVGTSEYRLTTSFATSGSVTLSLVRLVGGTSTTLRSVVVTGLVYAAGNTLNLHYQVSGTGTTTMQARAWQNADPEPATWLAATTDATASLQAPGAIALTAYISGAATNAPVTVTVKSMTVQGM